MGHDTRQVVDGLSDIIVYLWDNGRYRNALDISKFDAISLQAQLQLIAEETDGFLLAGLESPSVDDVAFLFSNRHHDG